MTTETVTAHASVTLLPAQQRAFDALLLAARPGTVTALGGWVGRGKTTVLRELQRTLGGILLDARDFVEATGSRHPLAVEEAFYQLVRGALAKSDVVLVDDVDLIATLLCCSPNYPRMNYVRVVFSALASDVADSEKQLIFGTNRHSMAWVVARDGHAEIADFTPADYAQLCGTYLGAEGLARLDVAKIHRFAPKLSATQLRSTCEALRQGAPADTDAFVEYLRANHMASNVDLGEVQAVDLKDLKGVDDVIRMLEANVVLPLENAELAAEFGLKPKRGVLLAGPPGTGKTTIGRALAHRLKGKFFLVDGTLIAGTASFYGRLHQIFEAAKDNAPSIIFIDDSDVIFEQGGELGLYRYLLTILDGIESASAGRVCLILTAMDVGSLPPALVRSGRIELWLDMRLPDEPARAAILAERCAELPASMRVGEADVAQIAAATDGLSGADLKRLVEDGKILLAYDTAQGHSLRPTVEYFLTAVQTVRANKERYAEAEARARARRPQRPPYFDVAGGEHAVFVTGQATGFGSGAMMGFSLDQLTGDDGD